MTLNQLPSSYSDNMKALKYVLVDAGGGRGLSLIGGFCVTFPGALSGVDEIC